MRKQELAPVNPLDVLRELAKQFNGRITPIKLYDGNVCSWTHSPGRSWEYLLVSGEPFLKQLRCVRRDHKIRVYANPSFLNTEVFGSFAIEHLSINKRNANNILLNAAPPFRIDDKQYPVFTEDGKLSSRQRSLLASPNFIGVVHQLDLQSEESMHLAEGSISAYLAHPPLARVTNAVDGLLDLVESIAGPMEDLDLTTLPVQFQSLIPLVKKWGISDDSDREDFLENRPKGVLAAFVAEVEPYLPSIDSYLDSFGKKPPSEAACALGRLAEAALQAKRLLKERSS